MRIQDLREQEQEEKDPFEDLGQFIAYHVDIRTATAAKHFCEDKSIPNPVDSDEMHVSLICSTKRDPKYVQKGVLKEPFIAKNFNLEVWKTQDNTKALVATFESDELQKVYNEYLDEYNFEPVYDELKPHFTISYDIQDAELGDEKNLTLEFNEYIPFAFLIEEYAEPLDQEWLKKLRRKKKGKKNEDK